MRGRGTDQLGRSARKGKHMSTDFLIQVAVVVVALAALGVSVWEGVANRRHNRLSVMPRLSLELHLAGSKGQFGLSAFNAGLGPALLMGCELRVDGVEVKVRDDDGWNDAISCLHLSQLGLSYETLGQPGTPLPAGDRMWLLSFPADAQNALHIPAFESAMTHLKVRIQYESIYGATLVAEY